VIPQFSYTLHVRRSHRSLRDSSTHYTSLRYRNTGGALRQYRYINNSRFSRNKLKCGYRRIGSTLGIQLIQEATYVWYTSAQQSAKRPSLFKCDTDRFVNTPYRIFLSENFIQIIIIRIMLSYNNII